MQDTSEKRQEFERDQDAYLRSIGLEDDGAIREGLAIMWRDCNRGLFWWVGEPRVAAGYQLYEPVRLMSKERFFQGIGQLLGREVSEDEDGPELRAQALVAWEEWWGQRNRHFTEHLRGFVAQVGALLGRSITAGEFIRHYQELADEAIELLKVQGVIDPGPEEERSAPRHENAGNWRRVVLPPSTYLAILLLTAFGEYPGYPPGRPMPFTDGRYLYTFEPKAGTLGVPEVMEDEYIQLHWDNQLDLLQELLVKFPTALERNWPARDGVYLSRSQRTMRPDTGSDR
jgi:hypothetical protein